MSRRSRSDAHMEFWFRFCGTRGEGELDGFHRQIVEAVRRVCEEFRIQVYAEDFTVKDHKVTGLSKE